MAEIFQSIDSLEVFMADLICDLIDMDDEAVLLQNQEQGQPSASINDDVAYVKINPETDERFMTKNRRKKYNEKDHTYTFSQQSYRTLSCYIIFYGPSSIELSTMLVEKLYCQDAQIRLRKNNLSLIPDKFNGPIRINEQRNGQWFKRCDLTIGLYNTIQVEETVETFTAIAVETEVG